MRISASARRVGERQHADEQAHREADAAEACRRRTSARHVAPSGLRRQAARDGEPVDAEDADRLADEQPERDAERHRLQQCGEREAGERYAGIGEGEQRQHAERDPGMQALLELLESERLSGARALERYGEASTTPASVACTPDFSTHTRCTTPMSEIGRDPRDAASVEQRAARRRRAPPAEQRVQRQARRVEDRDDEDGAEVVEDRERQQEHLQRRAARAIRAAPARRAQRRCRWPPESPSPAARPASPQLISDIDQRRHDHAADRGDDRQHGLARCESSPSQDLALDLETDEEEEHRHQAVVDPQHERLAKCRHPTASLRSWSRKSEV